MGPTDLYFHESLGEEFRLDEHSSIIALALEAANSSGNAAATGLVSPFDLSLGGMGHRRVTSMSMEGLGFRDSVPTSTKATGDSPAVIPFPTSPPEHPRITIGDSPVESTPNNPTTPPIPQSSVESPTTADPPSNSNPDQQGVDLQQEQTMEQLFLNATNRQATMASENFAMSDLGDAVDILLGGKSKVSAKK